MGSDDTFNEKPKSGAFNAAGAKGQDDEKIIEALLKAGAKPGGKIPLDYAREQGGQEAERVINALLEAGAKSGGKTPLDYAREQCGQDADRVIELLKAGARLNDKTPLDFVREQDEPKTASLLLKAGAKPGIPK